MQEKERIAHIISELEKLYPQDLCSLQYRIPHELLIAVRLSAQCTDARVNQVVPALFAKYPSIEAFAEADVADVEEMVRSCGFYHTKARDIVEMCKMLRDEYGGVVPDSIEELTRLPASAAKQPISSVVISTANLPMFAIPTVSVSPIFWVLLLPKTPTRSKCSCGKKSPRKNPLASATVWCF